MKKIIILSLILFECCIVFVLGFHVYTKQGKASTNVLGINQENSTSHMNNYVFSAMKKDDLVFNSDKIAPYFEFRPDIIIEDKAPWLANPVKHYINHDGLNASKNYSVEKAQNTFRIITLGDSFTYGLFVPTNKTFSEELEKLLNGNLACKLFTQFEVINLGVESYDIQFSVERFRLKGQKYNPDLVLWFLKEDDFKEIKEIMMPLYQEIEEQLRESGEYEKEEAKGNYFPHVGKAFEYYQQKYGDEFILEKQKTNLFELTKYMNKKIVIFSYPYTEEKYQRVVKEFLDSRENIYFYNDLVDFYKLEGSFPDMHPNEKGHALIANNLFTYLTKSEIIPCNK